MKAVCVLTMLLFLAATGGVAQSRKVPDSVNVLIRLHPRDPKNPVVDSVLVIFDRFDRTGAGVIKRIYYPTDNQFTIFSVPEGKYYINIYCLGFYRDSFSDLMFVSKRHTNNLRYKLKRNDEFIPGTYLPDMEVDFTNLAITNIKSFR